MHVAIDLGAGSGRAFLGQVRPEGLDLREVHRFHYGPRHTDRHLRWDVPRLYDGLVQGLQAARAAAETSGHALQTVGVDAWGVDYGLFHATGRLLEEPISYRDERTAGVMAAVFERVPRATIFAHTGIQHLPINTLHQLVAHVRDGLPAGASRLLMIPDICHHFLSGARTGEYTNATTTQLLNARSRKWDDELLLQLGLPRSLLPPLVQPGADLGTLRAARQAEVGGRPIRVIAPASHDTASAVVGTPLRPGWAFISSGTWSLVGVERTTPLLEAAVAEANFTNEGGAFGTVRFLRNVMGLWLLEACRRDWGARAPSLDALIAAAAAYPRPCGVVDPDDVRFLNPPSMTATIRSRLVATGQKPPEDEAGLVRVILDSLALRYAAVIDAIERLTGDSIAGIHIVGGGSRNAYLNQATASATGRPVIAGPVEATAAGNVIVQAMAEGELSSVAEGREQVARSAGFHRYEPRGERIWPELAERLRAISAT
jgi:rhamnulokinase